MSTLATHLADRVEEGAGLLAHVVLDLTEEEWRTVVHPDGRAVGVTVHHVGFMYPIEMDLVRKAVSGTPIVDVTWPVVAEINARHVRDFPHPTKSEALELLARNSRDAADEIRRLTTADLERAVPFSLSSGAPMTAQYIIEDHAVKHPWHHLARIRATLGPAIIAR